jgi:serine/threonine protein kinase
MNTPNESSANRHTSDGQSDDRPDESNGAGPPFESIPTQRVAQPEITAQRIGNYRLLQLIGEGGMGAVWIAEQSEPVKRRVALKVIKPGIGSKEILARFEAERQALALMNHPNIARILDAGATTDGQPYFAMELVQGKPLTNYCDENKLGINERLELFADVCSGVQHAHQKGIIHRDLKPSNVLVSILDGKPVVKVIDFGLAKAMESTQRLTDQSLYTGIGQILGTLKYMSPEQASVDSTDIDTRTDIYALGVILYELLTGSTPLDDSSIKGQAVLKVLETIQQKEPIKPSSRLGSSNEKQLSTITGHRKTDRIRLNRVLAGDLDWIVMKALEKDRTRRYDSASGFAADIQRYLNSEPVIARPPSLNYRIRKFVGKNRTGVIASSTVVLFSVLALVFSNWITYTKNLQIEASRVEAVEAKDDAEASLQFIVDVIQRSDPNRGGSDLTLAEVLDGASIELLSNADMPSKRRSHIASVIASCFMTLAKPNDAIRLLNYAISIEESLNELNSPDIWLLKAELAGANFRIGNTDQAIDLVESAFNNLSRMLEPTNKDLLSVLSNLILMCNHAGKNAKAEQLTKQALQKINGRNDPGNQTVITFKQNLAISYLDTAPDQGLALLYEVLADSEKYLGPQHTETLRILGTLGTVVSGTNLDEALSYQVRSYDGRLKKLGPDHPDTVLTRNELFATYFSSNQPAKALPLLKLSLEHYKRVNKDTSGDAEKARAAIVKSCLQLEMYSEAEEHLKEWLSPRYNGIGTTSLQVKRLKLGNVILSQGRVEEALEILQLLRGDRVLSPTDNCELDMLQAEVLSLQGDTENAKPKLEACYEDVSRLAENEYKKPLLLRIGKKLLEIYLREGDESNVSTWRSRISSINESMESRP